MSDSNSGIEAWEEYTNPFDRVRSVSLTVSEPQSASWIANEAAVSETTAHRHLERLVELTILVKFTDTGTTMYAPDPLYTRFQAVRDLLDEHDRAELISLKEEYQTQIETWRDKYEVESPEELRERATGTDIVEETTDIRRMVSDWELTEYRLGIVKAVVGNYATYSAARPST